MEPTAKSWTRASLQLQASTSCWTARPTFPLLLFNMKVQGMPAISKTEMNVIEKTTVFRSKWSSSLEFFHRVRHLFVVLKKSPFKQRGINLFKDTWNLTLKPQMLKSRSKGTKLFPRLFLERRLEGSGSQPGGHSPFGEVTYQTSCLSDIYITNHNNSKNTAMK